MKKVLILVISSDFEPYSKMIETSLNTWDSLDVAGVETFFYCSQKDNPKWENTNKILYFPVDNTLYSMGYKNLAMFQWVLENKEFDYILRINASCYVDKRNLIEYVQNIPETNLIAGAEATSQHGFQYLWGGASYLISKDVFEAIVHNGYLWEHRFMEDESVSLLVTKLGIPYSEGKACSINKTDEGWMCLSYGGVDSILFTDFNDLKRLKHFSYRVKQDGHREVDEYLMEQLFKTLQ